MAWIFVALVGLAVATGVGAFFGLLYRGVWGAVHGADLTREAARAIALLAIGQQLALLLVLPAVEPTAEVVGLALLMLAFCVPYAGALYGVLRSDRVRIASGATKTAPEEADVVARDHDGLTFEVRYKPAWVSALVTAFVVAAPLPGVFAAVAWARSYRRATVRIRNDEVEVDGEKLRLHGARLGLGARRDGTPVLRLVGPDGSVDVPVGATPPAELAWVRETLAAAIREAEDTRLPPEPEALRRLAARVQQ